MAYSLQKQLEMIAKKLQPKINNIMQNEIYEEVKDVARKHVQQDVYDVYKPIKYKRSGLLMTSWNKSNTKDGIEVFNTRYGTNRICDKVYVAKVVETGEGYEYPLSERAWIRKSGVGNERPFIENTREELKTSGNIEKVLMKGLKEKGIRVK